MSAGECADMNHRVRAISHGFNEAPACLPGNAEDLGRRAGEFSLLQ